MLTRSASKAVRPARLLRFLALAAALCGVLVAASLVSVQPASAEDVTIWSTSAYGRYHHLRDVAR